MFGRIWESESLTEAEQNRANTQRGAVETRRNLVRCGKESSEGSVKTKGEQRHTPTECEGARGDHKPRQRTTRPISTGFK